MKIRLRRDISAKWATVNPILEDGELGLDKTTGELRVGDGSTPWTSLKGLFKKSKAQWDALFAHLTDTNNPHGITKEQLAIPAVAWNLISDTSFSESVPSIDITSDFSLYRAIRTTLFLSHDNIAVGPWIRFLYDGVAFTDAGYYYAQAPNNSSTTLATGIRLQSQPSSEGDAPGAQYPVQIEAVFTQFVAAAGGSTYPSCKVEGKIQSQVRNGSESPQVYQFVGNCLHATLYPSHLRYYNPTGNFTAGRIIVEGILL